MTVPFKAVCGPKFTKFRDGVGTPRSFRRPCAIVYHVSFRAFSP